MRRPCVSTVAIVTREEGIALLLRRIQVRIEARLIQCFGIVEPQDREHIRDTVMRQAAETVESVLTDNEIMSPLSHEELTRVRFIRRFEKFAVRQIAEFSRPGSELVN